MFLKFVYGFEKKACTTNQEKISYKNDLCEKTTHDVNERITNFGSCNVKLCQHIIKKNLAQSTEDLAFCRFHSV